MTPNQAVSEIMQSYLYRRWKNFAGAHPDAHDPDLKLVLVLRLVISLNKMVGDLMSQFSGPEIEMFEQQLHLRMEGFCIFCESYEKSGILPKGVIRWSHQKQPQS